MHITNANELQVAIDELKRANIELEIKMKNQIKDLVANVSDDIVGVSVALGGGILAKKIFPLKKDTIIKNLVSYGVQGAVTTAAINNAGKIKALATAVWKNIFKRN